MEYGVLFRGSRLVFPDAVMEEMNLKDGQSITLGQVWEALALDTAHFVTETEARMAAGEKKLSDTTRMRKRLHQGP